MSKFLKMPHESEDILRNYEPHDITPHPIETPAIATSEGVEEAAERLYGNEANLYGAQRDGFIAGASHILTTHVPVDEVEKIKREAIQQTLDYLHANITASIKWVDFHDYSAGIDGAEVDYFPETADEILSEIKSLKSKTVL